MDVAKKGSKYYLAKKTASDRTVTSSDENIFDDVVDITEDDLDEGKDSDTDSGSYWSAIDEDEEEEVTALLYPQDSLSTHKTDECVETDIVHTAIMKEYGNIEGKEGLRVILTENGNIPVKENIMKVTDYGIEQVQVEKIEQYESSKVDIFEDDKVKEQYIDENQKCKSLPPNEDKIEEEVVATWVNKIITDEAIRLEQGLSPGKGNNNLPNKEEEVVATWVNKIITDEAKILEQGLSPEKGNNEQGTAKNVSNIESNSTFQNFHSHIAYDLQVKTGSPGFEFTGSDDVVDTGNDFQKTTKQSSNIEDSFEAYDVIDQFDIKVSEKLMDQMPLEPKPMIEKLHAFAAGVRRTMSFRKPVQHGEEFEAVHLARRTKSETHAMKKQPIDDFVKIEYTTRKEENGEEVKVLVVSPMSSNKQLKDKSVDGSNLDNRDMGDEPDGSRYDFEDGDIGTAHDLDGEVRLEKFKKLDDEMDIISLSGVDGTNFPKAVDIEKGAANESELLGEEEDAFDESKPVRPPRPKKIQKDGNPDMDVPKMKRGSSESDIHKNYGTDSSMFSAGRKNKSVSSYDVSKLAVGNTKSKSISDENIFKGMLPFLESDSKKKTLSGTASKTLPPDREMLYLFTDGFPAMIPDFPQDKRSLIANEIFTTERSFVRGLELLVKLFKKKAVSLCQLDKDEVEKVFSNVDEILDFNKGILDEVYQRINNWNDDQTVGDIFVKNADKFRIYAKYCQNYDTSEALIKHKAKKKKDFAAFLQACYSNPSCQIGLTLPSYLITIVQRIPRYVLLLKDLLRKTPPSHPDYSNLTIALKKMEDIATYINNQLKLSQSEKALAALEQQIVGLKAYYFSGRTLVHEGPVCLMNIKRTYQCVLFNDLMVFASKGESKQSVVDLVLDLNVVWFQDLEQLDPQTTKEDAIGLYTPDRPYTIYVGTKAAKRLWLQHIRNAIISHIFGSDAPQDSSLSKRNATHTYKNGAVYSGEFMESKREGEGTMMWPNQMTYRGMWVDDERNGRGVLEYGTGEIYDGEWKNDRLHGSGCCKCRNGDEIVGQWKIGIRHGDAKISFANGDTFEGTFKSDRIEGEGKLICKNGMHYEGTWKRNMKYGSGKLRMIDGNQYEGSFKNDFFNGDGVLNYTNGAVYRGEFEDGQRHGCGTYTMKNGTCYEGHWQYDLKDGTGILTFPNGDVYEGSFIEDKRSGDGVMKYENGGRYSGHWENDKKNGHGVMEYKDGSKYEGNWLSGQRSGQGKQAYLDGTIYDGEWKFDMYSGKGILEKPNGWKYKGDWLNGKQHGSGTIADASNNYKFQGEWQNGKKEGKGIEMIHEVLYEGEFKNNKRDGHGIETAEDQTTYEGNWRVGQKHGRGAKKLLNGMVQPQVWHMGCLMDCPVLVAREIPPLVRS